MSGYSGALKGRLFNLTTLHCSCLRLAERRRQLEAAIVRLEARANEHVDHVRGLLAQVEDSLSTSVGPLTFYRVYLLDDDGGVLVNHGLPCRDDIHSRDDAGAIQAGWRWVNLHNADQAAVAVGVEIWRGRRLVFSSRQ